ncbi:hypothetical protein ETU09_09950 [Apibacter muscae]|uniref:Uncharacterized protein n=1 Tax=Apibacter muscae TaxID=2509004 RepID=A0A563D9T6_9FLAO|nr:hypothetical protein [Apibacter muscae]TWP26867.1 hypothetical protein ETU09_09950 [Apibacter muscae]
MITKVETLDKIEVYLEQGSLGVYFQREKQLYYLKGIVPEPIQDQIYQFHVQDQWVYYQKKAMSDLYRVDVQRSLVQKQEGEFYMNIYKGKHFNYIFGEEKEEDFIYTVHPETFQIQNKFTDNIEGLVRGELSPYQWICEPINKLFLYDLIKKETLWEFPLEIKTAGDVFLYGDILLVPLENFNLLGLDAHSGKMLWQLEKCFPYHNLDQEKGLLYGFGGQHLQVIDIRQGKKIKEHLFQESKELGITTSSHMNALCGEYLWFTSWRYGQKFGKINLNTYQIEFVYEMKKGEAVQAALDRPKVYQGYIYIRDSEGYLHIYKEE